MHQQHRYALNPKRNPDDLALEVGQMEAYDGGLPRCDVTMGTDVLVVVRNFSSSAVVCDFSIDTPVFRLPRHPELILPPLSARTFICRFVPRRHGRHDGVITATAHRVNSRGQHGPSGAPVYATLSAEATRDATAAEADSVDVPVRFENDEDGQIFSHADPAHASSLDRAAAAENNRFDEMRLGILGPTKLLGIVGAYEHVVETRLPIRNRSTLAISVPISIKAIDDVGEPLPFAVSPEMLELGPGETSSILVTYGPQRPQHPLHRPRAMDRAQLFIVDDVSNQTYCFKVTGSVDEQSAGDTPLPELLLRCTPRNVVWPGLVSSTHTHLRLTNTDGPDDTPESLLIDVTVDDPTSGFVIDDPAVGEIREVPPGGKLDVVVRLLPLTLPPALATANLLVQTTRSLSGTSTTLRVPMLGYVGSPRVVITSVKVESAVTRLIATNVHLGEITVGKTYMLVFELKNFGIRAASIHTSVTDPSGAGLGPEQARVSPHAMCIRANGTRTLRIAFRPDRHMLHGTVANVRRSQHWDSAILGEIVSHVTMVVADEATRVCMINAMGGDLPSDVAPFCQYFDGEEVVRGRSTHEPICTNARAAIDLLQASTTQTVLSISVAPPSDRTYPRVASYGPRPRQKRSQPHEPCLREEASQWPEDGAPPLPLLEVSPARSDGTVVFDSSQSEAALVPSTVSIDLCGRETGRVVLSNTTPSTIIQYEALSTNRGVDVSPSRGTCRPQQQVPIFVQAMPGVDFGTLAQVQVTYTLEGERHQITVNVTVEPASRSSSAASQVPIEQMVQLQAKLDPDAIDCGIVCAKGRERSDGKTSVRNVCDRDMRFELIESQSARTRTTGQYLASSPFRFRRPTGIILAREHIDITADFAPDFVGDFEQVWTLRLTSLVDEHDVIEKGLTVRGAAADGGRSLIGTIVSPSRQR
jgi:hypothetical protein